MNRTPYMILRAKRMLLVRALPHKFAADQEHATNEKGETKENLHEQQVWAFEKLNVGSDENPELYEPEEYLEAHGVDWRAFLEREKAVLDPPPPPVEEPIFDEPALLIDEQKEAESQSADAPGIGTESPDTHGTD